MKTVQVRIWGTLELVIPDNAKIVSDRRGNVAVRTELDVPVTMSFNTEELEAAGIKVVNTPELDS